MAHPIFQEEKTKFWKKPSFVWFLKKFWASVQNSFIIGIAYKKFPEKLKVFKFQKILSYKYFEPYGLRSIGPYRLVDIVMHF